MQSERRVPSSVVETVIVADTELHGDITFSGQLRRDGCLHGDVQVADDAIDAMIVIGSKGRVLGNITVPFVVNCGDVVGNVEASAYLKVLSDGRIQGDVRYGEVEIEPGARIMGRLVPLRTINPVAINSDSPTKLSPELS